MDKEIIQYTCPTGAIYGDVLDAIVGEDLRINILANADELTITEMFLKDDDESIDAINRIIERAGGVIPTRCKSFHVGSTVEHLHEKIETLEEELRHAVSERDIYIQNYRRKTIQLSRVKSQIKAISLLLGEVFPEKQETA